MRLPWGGGQTGHFTRSQNRILTLFLTVYIYIVIYRYGCFCSAALVSDISMWIAVVILPKVNVNIALARSASFVHQMLPLGKLTGSWASTRGFLSSMSRARPPNQPKDTESSSPDQIQTALRPMAEVLFCCARDCPGTNAS